MKLGRRLGAAVGLGCLIGLVGCATSPGETPVAADTAAEPEGQVDKLVAMGDRAAAAGDDRTAISYYQQAAGLRATDAVALGRVGDALLREKRWQDAADVFGRILGNDPSNAAAHRGYARALMGLDQPGPAAAHLEEAAKAEPADARSLNMLGVAYDMLGRGGDAIAAYRRGLDVAPGDRSIVNNLGLSYALAGDFDAALAQLEPLANGADSTARARQNLALVYGLKGDMLAAERIGRLDLDPASVRGNLAFASALRAAGDPAASASALITELPADTPPTAARPRKARSQTAEPAPAAPSQPQAPRQLTASAAAGSAASPGATADPWAPVETSAILRPGTATAAPAAAVAGTEVEVSTGPAVTAPADVGGSPRPMPVTPAALALNEADIVSGLAPTGGWLIDLGTYDDRSGAAAAWRRLRAAHPGLLGGMTRLAGVEAGRQPLLVGPLASEGEADRICGSLAAQGVACSKLQV